MTPIVLACVALVFALGFIVVRRRQSDESQQTQPQMTEAQPTQPQG